MKRYLRSVSAFAPVAISTTATITLPKGPTYRAVRLYYERTTGTAAPTAHIAADITEVRVLINGVVRKRLRGSDITGMYLPYLGYAHTAGMVPLFFARPWMRTAVGEDLTQLGTRNVDVTTIEVDIAATAVTPVLELHAWIEPYQSDLGVIEEVQRFTFTAAAAGTFEISTLPKTQGSLTALHLSSSLITAATLKLDGVDHQTSRIAVAHDFLRDQGRAPVANWVHIEPQATGRHEDAYVLQGVSDYVLSLTMSGAGSVVILQETLNAPLGVQMPKAA